MMEQMRDMGLLQGRQRQPSVGIEIIDLWKRFNENEVFRGLTLEVLPGETIAIIGRTGIGKTVLLKHIIGLLNPDSGRIIIDGRDITAGKETGSRRTIRMGMVFQSSALFNSMTVEENVGLALRENRLLPETSIRKVVSETLDLVGLGGKEKLMPAECSGGMKKRVAIARALALGPDLLLFDEPTTGLDPLAAESLSRVMLDLKQRLRITSIVVSHDLLFACFVADRVAMLHDGRIIEVGTPEEIRSSSNPLVQQFTTTVPGKERKVSE